MTRPTNPADRVVIVGAGVAGVTAALTLRAEGHDGPLTLVGAEPHEPYYRPPLSKSLMAGQARPEDLQLKPPGTWAEYGIDLRTGTTVTAIDADRHTLLLDNGERLAYERLLLTTGGGARPLTLPGRSATPARVHSLRTLPDATALRSELTHSHSVLVIGAGLIGLELAATARGLGCEVTVLEAAPRPLARELPPWLGALLGDLHRDHGVDLHLGVRLAGLVGSRHGVTATADDGRTWAADLAVAAVGMAPQTTLARQAGLLLAAGTGGIVVNQFCETSRPGIYAAGDVTDQPHPLLAGRCRMEHWSNAEQQGAAAARNLLGRRLPYAPIPWCWSKQYGQTVEICGWPLAADTSGERGSAVRGEPRGMDFTALFWRDDRLVGAVSAGRSEEFHSVRRIIEGDPYVDLDLLADADTDLSSITSSLETDPAPTETET